MASVPTCQKRPLRVLSQNVWNSFFAGGPERKARLMAFREELERLQVDVVIVQEMFVFGLGPLCLQGDAEDAGQLLLQLGFVHQTSPTATRPLLGQSSGLVVYSKYPIKKEKHEVFASRRSVTAKGWLEVVIVIGSTDGSEAKQLKQLLLLSVPLAQENVQFSALTPSPQPAKPKPESPNPLIAPFLIMVPLLYPVPTFSSSLAVLSQYCAVTVPYSSLMAGWRADHLQHSPGAFAPSVLGVRPARPVQTARKACQRGAAKPHCFLKAVQGCFLLNSFQDLCKQQQATPGNGAFTRSKSATSVLMTSGVDFACSVVLLIIALRPSAPTFVNESPPATLHRLEQQHQQQLK